MLNDFAGEDGVEKFQVGHFVRQDGAQFIDGPDLKAGKPDDQDLSLRPTRGAAEVKDAARRQQPDAGFVRTHAAHLLIEVVKKFEEERSVRGVENRAVLGVGLERLEGGFLFCGGFATEQAVGEPTEAHGPNQCRPKHPRPKAGAWWRDCGQLLAHSSVSPARSLRLTAKRPPAPPKFRLWT